MPQILDQYGQPMSSGGTAVAKRSGPSDKALAKRYLSLVRSGRIRGTYDAAQTTAENTRHWANADALSADAAANADVRRTLRHRARYEVANNSYARGILLTLANDTIGTGPRLQLLTEDVKLNRMVEEEFRAWSAAIGLAEKLRTMRIARAQDGEAFALLRNNPGLEHSVQLDLALIEADRVCAPLLKLPEDDEVDGIKLDEYGNVVSYRVLKSHPGGSSWSFTEDSLPIDAKDMIHTFRADRPGQHRGVPEITPALPLFAQLRRFTLAVLSAAEAQAEHAGFIKTDQGPETSTDVSHYDPMETIEAERAMFTWLPYGWEAETFQSSQPASTYAEFKRELLTEIARCLNIPYNVAAGDSSRHNYASGRLDHQVYFKSILVDQAYWGRVVLDRILSVWLVELAFEQPDLLDLMLRRGLRRLPAHTWFWDGSEHVDPLKEEKARTERLENKTGTLADEWAAKGQDWEEKAQQLKREVDLYRELGLGHPADAQQPAGSAGDVDVDQLAEQVAEAVADRMVGITL